MGSIAFMMSLFYVTNTKDPDFVVYSWEVINKTISIFSAVLLFQATQGVVLFYTLGKGVEAGEERRLRRLGEEAEEEEPDGGLVFLVAVLMMLFWYMVLQLTLAYLTGAIEFCSKPGSDDSSDVTHYNYKMGLLSEEQKAKFKDMHVNLKCLGVLIGHITGFAAINALGEMQQMLSSKEGYFEDETSKQIAAFAVCVLSFFILTAVHKLTDIIRNKVALGDDGEIDEAEEMWQEETTEVEDDVIGLAISFLFIQAVRYRVGVSLPNVEGEDEDKHGWPQVVLLFLIGMGMMLLLLLKAQYMSVRDARKNAQLGNIVSMAFAWCLYFSVYWYISDQLDTLAEGMLSEVVISLIVTVLGLGLIAIADKLADAEWTAPEIDKIIRGEVVTAIGILIGFSWEKNFDKAVTTIAVSAMSENHPEVPILVKLVMSALCVVITVPAWWIYILPHLLESKEELDMRMAVEKINYMIKYPHKYLEWPTEVEALKDGEGVQEALLKTEGHGGRDHGDHDHKEGHGHHPAANEPDRRKVLKLGLDPKPLGEAIIEVDATRELANQEFQCLLNDGKFGWEFDEESGEWEVMEEKSIDEKISLMEEDNKKLEREYHKLKEECEEKLKHINSGRRLREVEEHNRELQQHIDGYGSALDELKRLAALLDEEHQQ